MLKDKIVFITGASSGIGTACATEFAKLGAKLIISARRIDQLNDIANCLRQEYQIEVLPIQLDVRDKDTVQQVINNLPKEWQHIDILVNNAGLALTTDSMQNANTDNWDNMIDVNLKGLLYVTRNILPIMLKNNSGHIVNIGSTAGHDYYPGGNVYSATKHAVRAISKSLRLDILGSKVRVSEVDPGAVGGTEFSVVRWNNKEKAKEFYSTFTPLAATDVADAVI